MIFVYVKVIILFLKLKGEKLLIVDQQNLFYSTMLTFTIKSIEKEHYTSFRISIDYFLQTDVSDL